MIIIIEKQFFEVLIYETKFDICNEWDKKKTHKDCIATISARVVHIKFHHVVH